MNQNKPAYDQLTTSALNQLGRYAGSPGNRTYCYTELAVSSAVVITWSISDVLLSSITTNSQPSPHYYATTDKSFKRCMKRLISTVCSTGWCYCTLAARNMSRLYLNWLNKLQISKTTVEYGTGGSLTINKRWIIPTKTRSKYFKYVMSQLNSLVIYQ